MGKKRTLGNNLYETHYFSKGARMVYRINKIDSGQILVESVSLKDATYSKNYIYDFVYMRTDKEATPAQVREFNRIKESKLATKTA